MTHEELKEILALLESAGVNAELCDTPVPLYDNPVRCGQPADVGDVNIDDYILLPKSMVGLHTEIFVYAIGDSMRDAGYEDGDRLRVRLGLAAHDGDNVLALVDAGYTVKTLFTDEDGTRWLVPQNEDYDAIRLTEDMDARIIGVVVGVEKCGSRVSTRALMQSVRRTKNKQRAASKLNEAEVDALIVHMGGVVKHARQWYAVYRAMVDYGVATEDGLFLFCERVKSLLPEHEHLPVSKDLSRVAVLSFAKPVAFWRADNAPVSGSRYRDYLAIAQQMGNMLGGRRG